MVICYQCGKQIKGKQILHVPANYLIKLGVDFIKSFHPSCYKKAELEASKELAKG